MTVTGEPGQHLLVVEPEAYLEVIAAAFTEAGADRAARLRDDLLIPLVAANLATTETGTAWRVVAAIRELWSRVEVPAELEPGWALLAEATRSGSPEEIGELATRLAKVGPEVWLTAIEPVDGGVVELGYRASLGQDLLPAADPARQRAGIVIRHREHGTERRLSGSDLAELGDDGTGLVWSGRAVLDAETAADGTPLEPGIWDAYVRVEALGLTRDVRLGARRLEPRGGLAELPVVVRPDGRIDQFYFTAYGNLSVTVRATDRWLAGALAAGRLEVTDEGVRFRSAARWAGDRPALGLELRRDDRRRARWRLVPATDGWVARPGRSRLRLRRGAYAVRVRVPDTALAPVTLDTPLLVDRATQLRWWRAAVGRRLRRLRR